MTRKSRRSNRRKKSDSSKSGDTPPCKINTVARMSQQQQVDTSQILAQAHDSINRSQQSLSGSPVMPQQLVFPNPTQAGLPNPGVQSNAPYIQIRHGIHPYLKILATSSNPEVIFYHLHHRQYR